MERTPALCNKKEEPVMFLMLAYIFTLCNCWFKPPADSGRTTFPNNDHKIQFGFQTCMAPGLSNGCAGLLVILCVFSAWLTTSQHPVNQHKPQESRNGRSDWNKILVFTSKKIHRLRHNDKSLLAETGARRP